MKISEEQLQLLNNLRCEKITHENTDWLEQIQPISVNGKMVGIADFFKEIVCNRDSEAYTSYVILSNEGTVLLFFTIRCGELIANSLKNPSQEEWTYASKCYTLLKSMSENKDDASSNMLFEQLVQEAGNKGISRSTIINLVLLIMDMKKEPAKGIQHVESTLSGIELVAFGKTSHADAFQSSNNLPKSFSQTVFWHIILNKVQEVQQIAGCKYIYLFAADSKPEGSLVSLYRNSMHLDADDGLGVNKPHDDWACWLQYQRISELKKWQQLFFDDFNPDEDDV